MRVRHVEKTLVYPKKDLFFATTRAVSYFNGNSKVDARLLLGSPPLPFEFTFERVSNGFGVNSGPGRSRTSGSI